MADSVEWSGVEWSGVYSMNQVQGFIHLGKEEEEEEEEELPIYSASVCPS